MIKIITGILIYTVLTGACLYYIIFYDYGIKDPIYKLITAIMFSAAEIICIISVIKKYLEGSSADEHDEQELDII